MMSTMYEKRFIRACVETHGRASFLDKYWSQFKIQNRSVCFTLNEE